MKGNRTSSKAELERSILEMVRAARRFIELQKNDPSRAGICKVRRQQIERIEKQVYKLRKKADSKHTLVMLAKELAELISDLFKSLIRYLLLPYLQWCSLIGRGYIRQGGEKQNEHWNNFEAPESCLGP